RQSQQSVQLEKQYDFGRRGTHLLTRSRQLSDLKRWVPLLPRVPTRPESGAIVFRDGASLFCRQLAGDATHPDVNVVGSFPIRKVLKLLLQIAPVLGGERR